MGLLTFLFRLPLLPVQSLVKLGDDGQLRRMVAGVLVGWHEFFCARVIGAQFG